MFYLLNTKKNKKIIKRVIIETKIIFLNKCQ